MSILKVRTYSDCQNYSLTYIEIVITKDLFFCESKLFENALHNNGRQRCAVIIHNNNVLLLVINNEYTFFQTHDNIQVMRTATLAKNKLQYL